MSIWKITKEGPAKIIETGLKQEKVLEENLEDWVIKDPTLLGEPLLIVGRQIIIPEVKDRLDVLALYPKGNAVIIELKRGKVKDPIDMQALRYASYISKWTYEDFESSAQTYYASKDGEFNFNELFKKFISDFEIDEEGEINSEQRIIIVGSEVKEKLGSVALWLYEHDINIKVIELECFKEGESIYIQPQIIVPPPVSRFSDTGRNISKRDFGKPWIRDGMSWHLEKRCRPAAKEMLLKLNDVITDNLDVSPDWGQKHYISYKVDNFNWLIIITQPNMLVLRFAVNKNAFDQTKLCEKLGVEIFDKDESFSEKFSLPSSLFILTRNEYTDRITLRIKEGFDLDSPNFLNFLKEAYKNCPK